MLTVIGHRIEPTRFPDGTTQVWKLPNEVLNLEKVRVDWRFEREDELFQLAQLRELFRHREMSLHVPYLPFARQDKGVSNGQTFALLPFTRMLNVLGLTSVTAVDVHNPEMTGYMIDKFTNVGMEEIHKELLRKLSPDLVVFPDEGAKKRYPHLIRTPHIVFEKERNQQTGEILGHVLSRKEGSPELLVNRTRLLIVDDICDGGATFLSIAKTVNSQHKAVKIDLFVTHGLFSKGRKLLEDAGLTLHTTNSLPRNPEGIPV